MASRRFDPISTIGLQMVEINGIIRQGVGSDLYIDRGKGFTVQNTGSGLYSVFFDDSYNTLESVECTVLVNDYDNQNMGVSFDPLSIGMYKPDNYIIFLTYNLDDVPPRSRVNLPIGGSLSFRLLLKNTAI